MTPNDTIHQFDNDYDREQNDPPSQTGWTLVTLAVLFAAGAVIGALCR